MDCIVYGVKKSQTRLSDFHWRAKGLGWDPGEKDTLSGLMEADLEKVEEKNKLEK